jgi:hypothetical protein
VSGSALRDDDRAATSGPRPIDREALLVALVLAPATYSRNRFFEMYKDPEVRRVRRRASLLRSVIRQLAKVAAEGVAVQLREKDVDAFELAYHVPSLGLRRTVRADALELAVLRFALGASAARLGLAMDAKDRERIDDALARLAPT